MSSKAVLVAVVVIASLWPSLVAEADAGPAIEAIYAAPGPSVVGTSVLTDDSGHLLDVYFPANLGADGVRHPIITWGNGTLTSTSSYAPVLHHLASWGFVVIATPSTSTGSGSEILAAARLLVEENQDPSSLFYQRLDTTRIGASGHSQGAYGALNAALKSAGLITTVVPIGLPDVIWLSPLHASDLRGLTQTVFFVGGGDDWLSTSTGVLQYVQQVPGSAVVALLRGGVHDGIVSGTAAYLGYLTAWMMYQLRGDARAAGAFVGELAEISANAAWTVPFRSVSAALAPRAPLLAALVGEG